MRFTDTRTRLPLIGLALLAACSTPMPPDTPSVPVAKAPVAAAPARPVPSANAVGLPPPAAVRSWNDVRTQAARRLMAANPAITYAGAVPDPLLAIPVLEIELNADGSIRRIDVMRTPRQAQDTVKIAIDAVQRAAPFGDISRLPKPWKFTETFLFNDDRKFKPRTLDS